MIRLEGRFIDALLRQPESGMGFQIVELEYLDGRRDRGVAYNAELVLTDMELRTGRVEDRFRTLLTNARGSERLLRSLSVQREFRTFNAVRESSPLGQAKDAPVEATKSQEVFKRYSGFEKDRRVTADKGLLPGTYATTEEDAQNVHSGSAAVRRYALPNSDPASWVFTSSPWKNTPIQRGIVAPANGQPGGGAEVIFPNGTQDFTTTGPVRIPD